VAEKQTLSVDPLNDKLNPICHLLALLGAHHILHVSRIRVKIRIHFTDCWTCLPVEVNLAEWIASGWLPRTHVQTFHETR
jgi:hypothetical protein